MIGLVRNRGSIDKKRDIEENIHSEDATRYTNFVHETEHLGGVGGRLGERERVRETEIDGQVERKREGKRKMDSDIIDYSLKKRQDEKRKKIR